ncbi:MAG: hypothetical protein M1823_000864 [Watsoniomyces obsoletus]|nr:MAG: hypothetical protein M1823_000864 [Watsoniomyces obsoletus]
MRLLMLLFAATSLGSTLAMPVGETQSSNKVGSTSSPKENEGLRIPGWASTGGLSAGLGALWLNNKHQAQRRSAALTPPGSGEPTPPGSGGVKHFWHADYKEYEALNKEIIRRTSDAQPADEYGLEWIYTCRHYRENALFDDLESWENLPDDLERVILGTCAQEYFDWKAIHGPGDSQRLPMPTMELEKARAEKLKAKLQRRVKGQEGSTEDGNSDIVPLQFAGVKLPRVRTGVNLAELKRTSTDMLAQGSQAVKMQKIPDIPKWAAMAVRNVPKARVWARPV